MMGSGTKALGLDVICLHNRRWEGLMWMDGWIVYVVLR